MRTVPSLLMGRETDEKCSFLDGAAFIQLQSLATGVHANYGTLKKALHKKFVSKEQVKLLKAEFHARHHDWDQKLRYLASS